MIDKGLYKQGRVGLKGGADASQFGVPADLQQTVNVGAGSATLGDTPLTTLNRPPTVRDNRNDDTPFVPPTKKKKTVDDVVSTGGSKQNPLKKLLSFLNPLSYFQMLNNPETRKRLTGYETQAEYEQARQNRINLNRIKTIENTLARKYSDGDYSQTDLDERLAALKSQMGITPNTAADLRPDLDFSNLEEGAPDFVPQNEGINSLNFGDTTVPGSSYDRAGVNYFTVPSSTYDRAGVNYFTVPSSTYDMAGVNEGLGSIRNRVGPENTGFIEVLDTPQSQDKFFTGAMADAKPVIDNRTLLEKLLNPNLKIDEALDKEEQKRKREQELLEELMLS